MFQKLFNLITLGFAIAPFLDRQHCIRRRTPNAMAAGLMFKQASTLPQQRFKFGERQSFGLFSRSGKQLFTFRHS